MYMYTHPHPPTHPHTRSHTHSHTHSYTHTHTHTHSHTHTHTQHVSLDHLNLRLADTEFSLEAFAAFRSCQLQAPRAYILDPSTAHPLDLSGGGGGEEGTMGAGGEGELLRDLIMVSEEGHAERRDFASAQINSLLVSRKLSCLHVFLPPFLFPDLPLSPSQPGLVSSQEEWTLGRRKHMYDVNSFRCQRQPMYGSDLVHTIRALCQQERKLSSATPLPSPSSSVPSSWLWAGSLACQLLQGGVRPEEGGAGSLLLSQGLISYERRAAVMEATIKRSHSSHCHTSHTSHHTSHITLLTSHSSHCHTPHFTHLTPHTLTSHSSHCHITHAHFSHITHTLSTGSLLQYLWPQLQQSLSSVTILLPHTHSTRRGTLAP